MAATDKLWQQLTDFLSDFVPIQYLNGGDLPVDDIKGEYSRFWRQSNSTVTGAVCSGWFRFGIEHRTETISTVASANDSQFGHLTGQNGLTLSRQQRFKLIGQFR